MHLGLALKWPERNDAVKKKKLEVRRQETVDWATTVWFEHEAIPVPFVADREALYLETIVHHRETGGCSVVRKSVELDEVPAASGRVRGTCYIVMDFKPCAEGTEETLTMEFDLKGRIPGRAVDGFLAQQAKLFDRL